MSDFSKSLLVLRKKMNLRQKEMADKLNIPVRTYRSYEYDHKTPGTLAMAELQRRIEALKAPKNV